METQQVDQLLAQAVPLTPEGVDLILDLRQVLLEKGHPGDCVKCFFALLGNLQQPRVLNPLRVWLESNLEVSVRINGKLRETLPVDLDNYRNLSDYCQTIVNLIRQDRAYSEKKIELSFDYQQSRAS